MLRAAFKFLKICGEEVGIAFGHDCDSIASAGIFSKLLKKLEKKPRLFVAELNYSITEKDLEKMRGARVNSVVLLDLGDVPPELIAKATNFFPVLIVDHHLPKPYKTYYVNPRIKDVKAYIPTSYLCWLIYKKFFENGVDWIAGVGTLADFGVRGNEKLFREIKKMNPELVRGRINQKNLFERSILGFLVKFLDSARIVNGKKGASYAARVLAKIENWNELVEDDKLFNWFNTSEKEIKEELKKLKKKSKVVGEVVFYLVESKLNLKSSIASYSKEIFPNKVVAIGQRFGNYYEISFRSKKKIDLSSLVSRLTRIIPNSSGGGHPSAAALRIPAKSLNYFLEKLSKLKK